jgi:amino acid permease
MSMLLLSLILLAIVMYFAYQSIKTQTPKKITQAIPNLKRIAAYSVESRILQ